MTMRARVCSSRTRRGAAAVATIILLMLMNLIIVGMIIGGARESDLTVRRLETVQAFYAAEGGMNMAIRELMENSDEDGDGTVGSISDDADDGNNPTLGSATLVVTLTEDAGETTLVSKGAAGEARREMEAKLEH
jgi:type II secretory pathway component PulK